MDGGDALHGTARGDRLDGTRDGVPYGIGRTGQPRGGALEGTVWRLLVAVAHDAEWCLDTVDDSREWKMLAMKRNEQGATDNGDEGECGVVKLSACFASLKVMSWVCPPLERCSSLPRTTSKGDSHCRRQRANLCAQPRGLLVANGNE